MQEMPIYDNNFKDCFWLITEMLRLSYVQYFSGDIALVNYK